MAEKNPEAERVDEREAIREEIKKIVGGSLYDSGEEMRGYFDPDEIADGVLGSWGGNLREKARDYFDRTWHYYGRIEELPPEFKEPVRDKINNLIREIGEMEK